MGPASIFFPFKYIRCRLSIISMASLENRAMDFSFSCQYFGEVPSIESNLGLKRILLFFLFTRIKCLCLVLARFRRQNKIAFLTPVDMLAFYKLFIKFKAFLGGRGHRTYFFPWGEGFWVSATGRPGTVELVTYNAHLSSASPIDG